MRQPNIEIEIKLRALLPLSQWLGEKLGRGEAVADGEIGTKYEELKEQAREEMEAQIVEAS